MPRTIPLADLERWLRARLPDGWFEDVEVVADAEEVLLVGTIAAPPDDDPDETPALRGARLEGVVERFREETRPQRVRIAREAEASLRRKVSWGVRCGGVERLFTTNSTPVMTRLRLTERRVIDTLVDAGVARSRSEALAWCVRRVAESDGAWLEELRAAFARVEAVRVGRTERDP